MEPAPRPPTPHPATAAEPTPPASAASGPSAAQVGPWRCARDPSVETYLRCGRCDTPICPRCLVQTSVGSRCRDCGLERRLPMFVLGPLDYLKAIGGALAGGIGGSIALILIRDLVPFAGILGILLMAGLGYVTGEAVARCCRRKSGNVLGVIAALGVVFGLILARAGIFIIGGNHPVVAFAVAAASLVFPLWNVLGLAIAAFVAFSRAR
ncbi:MAG: hypothetical protein U0893_26735 [Chloroflexota bacterium]